MDSSSVASHVVGMVKGVTTSFVIDMGIVLQVNSKPHLVCSSNKPAGQLAAGNPAVSRTPAAHCCMCSIVTTPPLASTL